MKKIIICLFLSSLFVNMGELLSLTYNELLVQKEVERVELVKRILNSRRQPR
jgi:hypothetical protein